MRADQRSTDQLRQVVITPDYVKYAEGSVLIEVGDTWLFVRPPLKEIRSPLFCAVKEKDG